jgi:alpha-tubulin suppressor-like RCC1 family protein
VWGLASGVVAITSGYGHSCALTSAGQVLCWGDNEAGALGDGTLTLSYIPVAVREISYQISDVAAISAGGSHACARTNVGAVVCWGYNRAGQLGNSGTTNSSTPVAVTGLSSGVAAISAGGVHTCALTSTGGIQCWGSNVFGQLGNGTTTNSTTPVAVTGLSSGVVAIAAGGSHTCALTDTGAVKCWGYNAEGELGNGSKTNSTTPVAVTGLSSGVAAISAGGSHTCALTSAGAVKCWGNNLYGELGNGTNTNSNTPVAVSGLSSGVMAISAGFYHTCAVISGGAVNCWGSNSDGQLSGANHTNFSFPVAVTGLSSVVAIATGQANTCALTSTGAVMCWGYNLYGNLGNGTTTNSNTPVAVTGLSSGVVAISEGDMFTCALTDTGVVKCWGYNASGELGDGTLSWSTIPGAVTGYPSNLLTFSTPAAPPVASRRLGLGHSLTLAGASSSGLPVTFISLSPTTCSVNNDRVSANALGNCVIQASQAGDATYAPAVPVTRFIVVVAGVNSTDLNADGSNDLNWHLDNATGVKAYYADLMSGTSRLSSGYLDASGYVGWTLIDSTADLNGDGKSDLIWHKDGATGTNAYWADLKDGLSNIGGGYLDTSGYVGWTLIDSHTDLNGDGKSDLIWHKDGATGVMAYWVDLKDGLGNLGGGYLDTSGYVGWTLIDSHTDLNGDGKSDLIWHKDGATGTQAYWADLKDGLGNAGGGYLDTSGYVGWTLIGRRTSTSVETATRLH